MCLRPSSTASVVTNSDSRQQAAATAGVTEIDSTACVKREVSIASDQTQQRL
jgi:hypothetical protein